MLGHSSGMFGFSETWPDGIATYQGVTFFFVLSGFILAYVYPSIDNRAEACSFFIARVARVWPAHFLTFLLAIALLSWVPSSLYNWYGQIAGVLNILLLQAWVPISEIYFSFNGVSWSVSVEIFFYLNFIWLIRNFEKTWRIKLILSLACAVCMMLIWRITNSPEHTTEPLRLSGNGLIYISPFGRFFEFIIGMCFAIYFKRIKRNNSYRPTGWMATTAELALLAAVVIQIAYFGSYWFELGPLSRILPIEITFWLERSGVAPLYGFFILVIAFQRGVVSRWLSASSLVLLGEISYSIYLLHQIIIFWAKEHPLFVGFVPGYIGYLIYIATTIFAAFIMWRFMERPIRLLITKHANAFFGLSVGRR